ncbi:cation:H+ antiporter [Variovorax sp. TBS-050B]|uniref:sodium:calcium antiporter n=1 Tax=Variovorax sp. TBS-050B TaxID=2940551 RepID=UPI0024730C8C|nr:sodium:calcium antiporter [Variovorax sp. TBS-050B]MDH6590496.1 cation:H+ antiporter [Variovorax sp. TBS-050B]
MGAVSDLGLIWASLVLCGGMIAVAGTLLTRYADVIADKTGCSGAWIGLVLLATVTSLPELTTGISSVTLAGAPDVAVGNVLGACVLNLSYLAVLDLLKRDEPLFQRAGLEHVGLAAFGIVMLGLAGLGLAIVQFPLAQALGHVGWYTPALLLLYLLAVRSTFAHERARLAVEAGRTVSRYPDMSLRQAALRCLAAAAVVVAAGIWLPFIATELATSMQWSRSFVGTLLVAFVTSMPELVVTLSALRLGAIDMAVANLLGSNLFNVAILAIDDIFYARDPILAAVSPIHLVSVMSAAAMSGVVVIALHTRPAGRVLRLASWSGLALAGAYLFNAYVLFRHGA